MANGGAGFVLGDVVGGEADTDHAARDLRIRPVESTLVAADHLIQVREFDR